MEEQPTIEDIIAESLRDWTGPTVVIKGIERPDPTEDQELAAARRAKWAADHAED